LKWKTYWNLGAFVVLLENLWRAKFNNVYFTIFKAKVWMILFVNVFCCWKFKQIEKNGFGKKNQLSLQCVHTWANDICYISFKLMWNALGFIFSSESSPVSL
jgi:hypothetical protein